MQGTSHSKSVSNRLRSSMAGLMLGGGLFLRGQAEFADYDGISEAISGKKNQNILSII